MAMARTEVTMASVAIAHKAHPFPSRQIDVQVGEEVEVVERFDSGWWEVRTADGRVGRVPSNKLEEQSAPQEELRLSLSRSFSRRTLSARHRPATPPVPTVPALPAVPPLPEGHPGSPQPAGRDARMQPPAGLTKMEQIKWKREQHLRLQQARAGYGGDPAQSAAPADVRLEAGAPEEPAPSCLAQVGDVVGIELQRVAYSVWSKYLTAFSAGVVVLLAAMLLLCEAEEEHHISGDVARTEEREGTLTSFHQMGALASLGVALLLLLNERFWKLVPGRGEQKDGTLWIRMVLLVVLLVLQVVSSPILLGSAVVLLPICITLAGMRHGERDQPWPVQRGATKLEREDLKERKEQRQRAREAGVCAFCAEQIYRLKEEDTLGRYVILAVYIMLNVYKFAEAYFRWVEIVDSQGTCSTTAFGVGGFAELCR